MYFYICIYIYGCFLPESCFLYHLLPFWKLASVSPFFENLIFVAARRKMKVRNWTTGELFSVPPKSGTVSNSQGGTISNFYFALLIESQVGKPVVQFLTFSSWGVLFIA